MLIRLAAAHFVIPLIALSSASDISVARSPFCISSHLARIAFSRSSNCRPRVTFSRNAVMLSPCTFQRLVAGVSTKRSRMSKPTAAPTMTFRRSSRRSIRMTGLPFVGKRVDDRAHAAHLLDAEVGDARLLAQAAQHLLARGRRFRITGASDDLAFLDLDR